MLWQDQVNGLTTATPMYTNEETNRLRQQMSELCPNLWNKLTANTRLLMMINESIFKKNWKMYKDDYN